LSEHGEVIDMQAIILYLCDMQNNMHIVQSLSPQSFLTNSVPGWVLSRFGRIWLFFILYIDYMQISFKEM